MVCAEVVEDSPAGEWPAAAPLELIRLHAKISKGRALLGRLLSDPAMTRAWKTIGKRISDQGLEPGEQYQRLWGAILTAHIQARRNETRQKAGKPLLHEERASHCRKVARRATQLAKLMEEGPLDMRVCDVLGDQNAGDTPIIWVLAALEKRGRAEARRKPLVAKRSFERPANEFIRLLVEHFRYHLGGELRATLAAIANMALDRTNESRLTVEDIRRALPKGGGKAAKK